MLNETVTYGFKQFMQIVEAGRADIKIDPKIIRDDAKNNTEATSEILKQTAAYNDVGEIKRNTTPENPVDGNKTTLDANYTVEPSQDYKDRVKAQVEGYPSVANKKTSDVKENDSLDYEGNKKFYNDREEISAQREKEMAQLRQSGLTAQHLDPKKFERDTVYTKTNENKQMIPRLTFKSTFINEADVLKKIPEDYRKDGKRFMMEDQEGTQYVIECKADTIIKNFVHPQVVGVFNEKKLQEQKDRMMQLAGYRYSDAKTSLSRKGRINEDAEFGNLLKSVKTLSEQKEARD